MTIKIEPFVFETSTSIGTGVFALNSQTGFRTISSAIGTGSANEFYYFIRHKTVNEYEHGTGFIDGSGNLVRNTVILSSNADAIVSFSVGTKDITLDYAPQQINNLIFSMASGLVDPKNTINLSINSGDSAKFDITAGTLIFADGFTDANTPTSETVEFAAQTAVAVTDIATQPFTIIYINKDGTIVQKGLVQPPVFLRDNVAVGLLNHTNNTTISTASDALSVVLNNSLMSFADMSFCMGAINCSSSGQNKLSGNSGTLGLDKSEGDWYFHGINGRNDLKNPNILASAALIAQSMFIGWRTTDDPEGTLIFQNTVPMGVYDDDTAVIADALPQGNVTTNNWVNHRVFMVLSSNTLALQIGQNVYNSSSAAQSAIATEDFEILPLLAGTTPLATLTMRGGAVDLASIMDGLFRQAIPPRATFA